MKLISNIDREAAIDRFLHQNLVICLFNFTNVKLHQMLFGTFLRVHPFWWVYRNSAVLTATLIFRLYDPAFSWTLKWLIWSQIWLKTQMIYVNEVRTCVGINFCWLVWVQEAFTFWQFQVIILYYDSSKKFLVVPLSAWEALLSMLPFLMTCAHKFVLSHNVLLSTTYWAIKCTEYCYFTFST